jgi:protein-S-isoprenylcysteine O-methyltransferase Ste14
MIRYLICIALCAGVWIVNIKEIIHAVKNHISKFGDAYKDYIQKIPMWNVLSGLLRKQRVGKIGSL